MDVTDLSSTHKDNVKNNTWHVRTPFPTQEEMKEQEESGEYLGYEMYYAAEAWVTKDESLTFQVNLSHYVKATFEAPSKTILKIQGGSIKIKTLLY